MFTGWNVFRASRMLLVVTCVVTAMLPAMAWGQVKAASVFGSHMVLQQGMKVPVWGTADPGTLVRVTFANQLHQTQTDADGKWKVQLSALKATANQTGQSLTIQGSDASDVITFEDVLIGEVWLCSGQSNMAYQLKSATGGAKDLAEADFPQIRMLQVGRNNSTRVPTDEMTGSWQVCMPGRPKNFSAVAFYFGRKLHQELGIPVGLINSSVGGSYAATWISPEALLKNLPEFEKDYRDLVNPGHVLDEEEIHVRAQNKARLEDIRKLIEMEADEKAAAHYSAVDLDDSQWKTMELPRMWNQTDLGDYHGLVWLRKTVDVPADVVGVPMLLWLGTIYEIDAVYFNGKLVGQTNRMSETNLNRDAARPPTPERVYMAPADLVKAGKNVIAIRVMNLYRTGGFTSPSKVTMRMYRGVFSDHNPYSVALDTQWKYLPVLDLPQIPKSRGGSNRPSVLFGGMINPLIPYAVRGAMWYQGESNGANPEQYHSLLTTLINDWRGRWGQEEFEFLIVQLPNYGRAGKTPADVPWAVLRQAQTQVASEMDDVEQAITIDIGEPGNIHPPNKLDVGHRLALIALAKIHGKDVAYRGPVYKSHEIQGSKVIVHFDHLYGGLMAKDQKVQGFGLAGEDGQFVWADAVIQGDSVVVTSDQIASPVFVNYAWDAAPVATLYNKAGLPASAFTTKTK